MLNSNKARGIAFIVLGIALWFVFRGRALGMGAGTVFFIMGVVTLVNARGEN